MVPRLGLLLFWAGPGASPRRAVRGPNRMTSDAAEGGRRALLPGGPNLLFAAVSGAISLVHPAQPVPPSNRGFAPTANRLWQPPARGLRRAQLWFAAARSVNLSRGLLCNIKSPGFPSRLTNI